jgi:hypothetical protein
MKTNLLHYTLNTANTFDCATKTFKAEAIAWLKPIAVRAIQEGQTQSALPQPLDKYSVKVTAVEGAALFDIYEGQDLINTNAVAWTKEGEVECWQSFESLYLKLAGQFQTLSISRAPVCPNSLPWLATLVLPIQREPLSWLSDFEQCLAITLIAQANLPRSKPKGFGKNA